MSTMISANKFDFVLFLCYFKSK